MTKTQPSIYGYSIENMKQKIEDMEALGYSKEDIIKMTRTFVNVNIKMYNFWNIIMYNFVHYYIRFPSQTLVEFYLLIDMNFH